jgi:hypothetical protein
VSPLAMAGVALGGFVLLDCTALRVLAKAFRGARRDDEAKDNWLADKREEGFTDER